jgi:ketosteroid isomerase-like protein
MSCIQNNKAVVTDFLSTFSTGDVPAILSRMHDQGAWWVSGSIEGMSGLYTKEQLGALLNGVVEIYETGALKITPTSMISEGDVVAVEAESFARLTTGKVYNNRYHFRFTVQDGKVKEVREYMDTKHAQETFLPS